MLVLWAITLSACNSRRESAPPQPDALLGSWRVVSERVKAAGIEIIWTIDERHIVITDGSGIEISRSEYQTDPTQTPKYINMTIRGDELVEDRPGIYQLDENQLRFAFSVDGSPRPTGFDDRDVVILERVDDHKP